MLASVSGSDTSLLEQFKQLMDGQPVARKQIALDVLRIVFMRLETEE
jgi:hypothetical protein